MTVPSLAKGNVEPVRQSAEVHNLITIKTRKTEIGINGVRDWYLVTHFGRYRIERYIDLDGNRIWSRTDTVKEANQGLLVRYSAAEL